MGKEQEYEIRYTLIPNEISLVIKVDEQIEDIDYERIIAYIKDHDEISCIVFKANFSTGIKIKKIIEQFEDFNLSVKYGWISCVSSIPYLAGVVNYIFLNNNELYFRYNDDINKSAWVQITPIDKKDLNPIDPYYFEKFDEICQLNN